MPGGRPGDPGERLGSLRVAIVEAELGSGQDVPDHRDVAAALDAGAEDRDPAERPVVARVGSEPPEDDPADRRGPGGGDRGAVEDRQRQAGRRMAQDDRRADRRQAERAVLRVADDPLEAQEVVAALRIVTPEVRRHRVTERRRRPGVDGDLGRELGRTVGERDERPLGQLELLVERRQRRHDVGTGQVAERRVGHPPSLRVRAGPGSSLPSARDEPDRHRPEPRQPQARARRDRPLRRARRDRARSAPGVGLPDDRRQRAAPRRDLGRRSSASSAPRSRRPGGRGRASGSIIWLARLFGTRAVSDLVQALEGDEESTYEGQASPEVLAIAADEREHAEIWKRLSAGAPACGGQPG